MRVVGTKEFSITVAGASRKFNFMANTHEEACHWTREIWKHIDDSQGKKKRLKANKNDKFWKFQEMSED